MERGLSEQASTINSSSAVGCRLRELFAGADIRQVPSIVTLVFDEHSKRCQFRYNALEHVMGKIPAQSSDLMSLADTLGAEFEAQEIYCPDRGINRLVDKVLARHAKALNELSKL
jgi:hypothetical protein